MTLAFVDPPKDLVAQYPSVPLIGCAVLAVLALAFGIVQTRRSGSPLFFWAAVAGLTLYPFLVEPIGDFFVAVWYPTNLAIAAEPFGRPMPWFAVLFYGAGIPVIVLAAYEIARRLSAKHLLVFLGVFSVLEVGIEALGNHWGWMNYYGNPATVFGVPIYCLAQNGGFFAAVAWVLAWLLPRTHGWRWVLVPFALAAVLPLFALAGTWPAYLAIHAEASDTLIWLAAILSTALNAALVVWFAHSPALQRLRRETANQAGPLPARAPGAPLAAGA